MVDNRHATALVIGSVLSLLATVYLCASVGSQYWYQYSSPQLSTQQYNSSELHADFTSTDADEKVYTELLYNHNGTLGLWWRCIVLPESRLESRCVSFTLQQQFEPKYLQPGNHNSGEDVLRTYLWRCQLVLPLLSLVLVLLGALVGLCSCLCGSLSPTLAAGLLHLLAGVCTLATVCCFLVGMFLLHRVSDWPADAHVSLGWSLYLALVAAPLQLMAGALIMWAARSHRRSYRRLAAYRIA